MVMGRDSWLHLAAAFVLVAFVAGAVAQVPPAVAPTPVDAVGADRCENAADAAACMGLASTYAIKYGEPSEQIKAVPFYERACELGHANACHAAGEAYDAGKINRSNNALIVRDDARAVYFYQRGCDGGSPYACDGLGQLVLAGRVGNVDRADALKIFERGCDLNDFTHAQPASCLELGKAYSKGDGRSTDPALATQYLDKACHIITSASPAVALACLEAGQRFEGGLDGVQQMPAAALNRYGTACKRGSQDGCLAQQRLAAGDAGRAQRAATLAADLSLRTKQAPVCAAIWQESVEFRKTASAEGDRLIAQSNRDKAEANGSKEAVGRALNSFEITSNGLLNSSCLKFLDFRYRAIMTCSKEDGAAMSDALLADARAALAAMTVRADSPQGCRIGLQDLR